MTRLIRVVDFETTGVAPPAEVIEVGWCDVGPSGEGKIVVGLPEARMHGSDLITAETDGRARGDAEVPDRKVQGRAVVAS